MSHFLQIQRIRFLDSLPVPRIQNKRKHCSACTLSVQQCARVGVAGSLVSAWEVWEVVWEDPTLVWEDNSAAMGGWQGLWELPQWLTARTKWPFH